MPESRDPSPSTAGSDSPGRTDFDTLVTRLRSAVGDEHVAVDEDTIAHYSRGTIPWHRQCAVVVYPATTQEVSAVVQAAADAGFAVWPYSTGKNWGYGTTMAYHHGAVIMVLSRMNRILEVNEELAYAVIEPGVTQGQLNRHLRENGYGLWTDCTDSTPHASVIGNALERGIGYTPYGDHFGHLCGMEVVMPDGQVMQTGGGPPDSHSWHTYKWGTGPFLDGLFTQSNMGVVTRAGIWLMPEPEAFNFFTVEVRDAERLPELINAIRRLALQRAIHNVHTFNDYLLMTSLMQYPFEQREGQRLPKGVIEELRRRFRVQPWTLMGGLYGTRAQVGAHRRLVRRELKGIGRLMFFGEQKIRWVRALADRLRGSRWRRPADVLIKALTGRSLSLVDTIPRVYPILKGIPSEFVVSAAYYKKRGPRPARDINPARDQAGIIWFAPVVPATGNHVEAVNRACRELCEAHDIEYSVSIIMVNPRSVLLTVPLFYDRDDPAETERVQRLYEALCERIARMGYQQYRTSIAYMDRILGDAAVFARVANAIKDAVDPDHTLAPGRYGLGLPDE